jgi:hypothetical protein
MKKGKRVVASDDDDDDDQSQSAKAYAQLVSSLVGKHITPCVWNCKPTTSLSVCLQVQSA